MTDLSNTWSPLQNEIQDREDELCNPADFKALAESCKNNPNPDDFRTLCATAIDKGAISKQDFIEKFGDVLPNSVGSIPAPNIVRDILDLFSAFEEEQFTGSPIPWRHKAEDNSSPRPNT